MDATDAVFDTDDDDDDDDDRGDNLDLDNVQYIDDKSETIVRVTLTIKRVRRHFRVLSL